MINTDYEYSFSNLIHTINNAMISVNEISVLKDFSDILANDGAPVGHLVETLNNSQDRSKPYI